MVLFDYQDKMVENIFAFIHRLNSVLVQSATGSGKTVVMCDFIKKYIEKNPHDIVLVSVHREELVTQTSRTLAKMGIFNEPITAKSKNKWSFGNVYVGMTQTIYSRKTDLDVKLLIIDECHEQVHVKTFDFFPNAKRVGFTATPILNIFNTYYKCNYCDTIHETRIECCYNEPAEKWRQQLTLSTQYEDIILGPPIAELIRRGLLVDEIVFSFNFYENVKDLDDENEIAKESAKHDAQVLAEYIEKCFGKKTMIFTASTKQNISLVKVFTEAGLKIRSYDSVNNKKNDRSECIEWFRDTDDAILVSTGTFTTGFDEPTVRAILVNRPTKSLSLWHQIVGRGGRTCKTIFKDNFIVIDLGGNTKRFGKWSDFVDWRDIFWNGLVKTKRQKEGLIQCDKCGYNWIGQDGDECPDCQHVNVACVIAKTRTETELSTLSVTTVAEKKIPLPNPVKIAEFVQRTTNEKKDYYRIIIERYVDLWKMNLVSKTIYLQRIENGTLDIKIEYYVRNMCKYHHQITDGIYRSYKYVIEKIKDRLAETYR